MSHSVDLSLWWVDLLPWTLKNPFKKRSQKEGINLKFFVGMDEVRKVFIKPLIILRNILENESEDV